MKLSDVAKVTKGELIGHDAHFYGGCTDTRLIEPGQIFFAWKGHYHDAHDFVESIESKGAIAAIVERFIPTANITQIVVKDSQKALGLLAKEWRKHWQGTCIALTGSNGKTTVKEMLFGIFSQVAPTLATKGNLNNHVGCPLTLLQLSDQYQYAVIEMGANHHNEILYLTKITQPDVALLNNAGACHLEGFGSLAGVAEAKSEIFAGLGAKGIAILNHDDPFFPYWQDKLQDKASLSFGIEDNHGDVYASAIEGRTFRLHYKAASILVTLQLAGQHNILNACAAAAAALSVGLTLEVIKQGLEGLRPVEGRLQKIVLSEAITIINDAYNANPNSLEAGINALDPKEERWLLLGDMKELGPDAIALHEASGRYAKAQGIHRLYAFGELARHSAVAFGDGGHAYEDRARLLHELKAGLTSCQKKPLTLLVKGSNSMNMQYFIDQLIKE